MKSSTTIKMVLAAAVAAALSAGAAVAVTAAAANTTTTYYACLKSGTLSDVGTTAPKCSSSATQISWNQTGPAGPAGAAGAPGNTILSGTGAPTSTIGVAGNFYLETSTDSIYGPATRNCNLLPCKTIWGTGTSLVGPPGPAGQPAQTTSYDTSAESVNDPSGQAETVISQTLPVGGDFQVIADVTGENTAANSVEWICTLDAANPGGSTVTLGTDGATNTGSVNDRNETDLSVQGVVSIAAGGTVSLECGEFGAEKNDVFDYAHITSTQVSSFSVLPPG